MVQGGTSLVLPGGAWWCQVVPVGAMSGDPRCLKMIQNGPKMVPDGVRWYKVGSGGARWFQVVPGGAMSGDPRCLRMIKNGPRWYEVGSGGTKWFQVVPGGTRWCKVVQCQVILNVSEGSKMVQKWCKVVPFCIILRHLGSPDIAPPGTTW